MSDYREEVVAFYNAGKTIPQIGEALNLDTQEVYKDLIACGIRVRKVSKLPGGVSEEDANAIIQMYQSGEVIDTIVTAFDMNLATLYKLLKEKGVTLRTENQQAKQENDEKLETAISLYYQRSREGFDYKLWEIQNYTDISQNVLLREIHRRHLRTRSQILDEENSTGGTNR